MTRKEELKKKKEYMREYRKNNLEKTRASARKSAKKRYHLGEGKTYRLTYFEAMRILRDLHKEQFNKILKKLKKERGL